MTRRACKVLLIGYGNPGRLDDGLGPALATEIEKLRLPNVTVDSDYQLTVEDAAVVAKHDAVVFADAATSGPAPYVFERIEPAARISFSTHSVLPPAVLGLSAELFGRPVPGYCLGVRGYEFNEYREELSEQAQINLADAVKFAAEILYTGNFDEVAAELANAAPARTKII